MKIEDYLRSQGLEPVSKEDATENLEEGTQETEEQSVETPEGVEAEVEKIEEKNENLAACLLLRNRSFIFCECFVTVSLEISSITAGISFRDLNSWIKDVC